MVFNWTRLSDGPVSPSDSVQEFSPPFREEYPPGTSSWWGSLKLWWRQTVLSTEEPQTPSGYLTLIPLNDSRLRPRRTRLLVASLLVFAFVAALTTFFLVPRGISTGEIVIQSDHMRWNISEGAYKLNLSANIAIFNPNYLHARVNGQLKAFFYDAEAGTIDINSTVVPARSSPYHLQVVVDASNVTPKYVLTILSECVFPKRVVFFLKGYLTATGGLWGGNMGRAADIDTYVMIKCFNSEFR